LHSAKKTTRRAKMSKKIAILAMAMAFTAATIGVANSFTCTVKAVDGGTVTLECKEKYAQKLEVGKDAKVSPKKAVGAPEGC
jgi:hypothetical protein